MQRFLSLTALGLGLALGTAHASEGRTAAPVAASSAAAIPTDATAPSAAAPVRAGSYQVHEKFRSRTRSTPNRRSIPPKVCNVDASGQKGGERTASLSACLNS